MSEDLTIQGTLAETTVPDLFRSLIRSGETAILSLEAIGRHDTVFFSEGKIVNAATSDPDLGLGEALLSSGAINLAQYHEASNRVIGGRSIGSVLCDLRVLRPEELIGAEEKQVRGIVKNVLSYRTGSYVMEFASEFPKGLVRLPINTHRLVMDGIQQIRYWSLISRGLGRMNRLLRHAPDADARTYHLEMSDEEGHTFALLSEPQTIELACDRSYLSDFVTCRTLLAFLTVSLVEEAESSEIDGQRATIESEIELEAAVEMYNSAFQSLFALVFQEVGDHIWDFVDRVVRHVSPERLGYLSGMNLMNEGRLDFDQLLNNLISAGANDQRPVVNEVLSELLDGWISETRVEFGESVSARVDEITDRLRAK